jgi:FkbM family methyltransferase
VNPAHSRFSRIGGVAVRRSRTVIRRWLSAIARAGEIIGCCRETAQWWAICLAYARLHPLSYPYELRLRRGERITLYERTDVTIFWLVFVRGHYPVAPDNRTIIDVGANIGMFTLYAARQAPQANIVAIEPFPDTCARLRSLVERNGLDNRVTILNYAISGCGGEREMDISPDVPSQYRRIYSEMTGGVNIRHRNMVEQTSKGITVKAETLGELLDRAEIPSGDLLKMNIHGSEYDVLMSAPPGVLKRCKRIMVQYHELPARTQLDKRPLFQQLTHVGFKLVSDRDTHRGAGLAVFEQAA